jgi:hypothetical protein
MPTTIRLMDFNLDFASYELKVSHYGLLIIGKTHHIVKSP